MFTQSSVFCVKISMILEISSNASISLSFFFSFFSYYTEMKRQKTMKYNLIFLLDDADTKNKEMNTNTGKH